MDPQVASGSSTRDPFDLDRLADELAARERNFDIVDDELAKDVGSIPQDFPLYAPLSHSNPFFSSETFNVEEFLLSRSHTSLPDLRSELRDYLAALKEELVMLINDDYEAFISLSTDLKGEGVRLERMQWPLGDLKAQILESKRELEIIQEAIHTKLKKRSALRDEKAFLHLLLKISESVSRLESLLLIASPEDASSSPDLALVSHTKSPNADTVDGTRGNRAKHLARVAAEYTQLLYHVNKAQRDQQSAFINETQWRIDRIKSTLSSDLDHLFASTLHTVTKESKVNEMEKSRNMADLGECLRTYDVLGLWRDAEDVLKREVVREFIKKTIFPGALSAPRTPLVPHTPFPVRAAQVPNTGYFPLRTPYTPYTAFASKGNPFESQQQPTSHLLDETDNPLAALYNTILKFVDRDLKKIMELADKVSVVKKTSKASTLLQDMPDGPKERPKDGQGFEILANVVWTEVGRAIMDELGSTVFAAGKPDEFRKNHETTQAFLRALQYLAPSSDSVQAMTGHPVYLSFERRWQLPVYFQLRWQEIVTRLEEALVSTKIELSSRKDSQPFVTSQAAAVWTAITTCWSAEVYIPELSHRLWKLTLQLLSRYRTWLQSSLPRLEPPARFLATEKQNMTPGGTPPTLTRASTPIPAGEASSAESVAADEAILRQFAVAITDIQAMKSHVLTLWREEISMMLPDMSDAEEQGLPEDALENVLSTLTSLTPSLSTHIVAILSKRACEALLPVRSIPSQFRAMSNKRPPTEPSYFVPSILRPLKTFFGVGAVEGVGEALKPDYLKPYAEEVFENVVQRYIFYITAMKKTEESLRRLKKGKKATTGLFGTASLFGHASQGKEDDNKDEERIRTQMILDVEAFGKDAELLDVDVRTNSSFIALTEMVHASLADDV